MLGAVARVSGQRLASCGAVGLPSRSLPPSSLRLEVARVPPPRRMVRGVWVGEPGSAGGEQPAALSPPHPLALIAWAGRGTSVTCVVAFVGAGAAAVTASAGGSASG